MEKEEARGGGRRGAKGEGAWVGAEGTETLREGRGRGDVAKAWFSCDVKRLRI